MHKNVRPGTHINALGSYKPGEREIPEATVRAARLVVDQSPGLSRGGRRHRDPHPQQGLITVDHIHAEIGEIAAGYKPGRLTDTEITLFKLVGNAVQDAAIAAQVLDCAEALGLGTEVSM